MGEDAENHVEAGLGFCELPRPLHVEGSAAGEVRLQQRKFDELILTRVSERQLKTMLTTWVTVGRPVERMMCS